MSKGWKQNEDALMLLFTNPRTSYSDVDVASSGDEVDEAQYGRDANSFMDSSSSAARVNVEQCVKHRRDT